ncbi:MAG: hypothetical protein QF619_04350 [Candidatus Binatia bacterium]|nr:hypothetical protein [Candidatus Binatia bacterium]
MGSRNAQINEGPAERLVDRLLHRLRRHGLWDALLVYFPPLLACAYLVSSFAYHRLAAAEVLVVAAAAVIGLATAYLFYNGRLGVSKSMAARLIDSRVEGKDRFVTLTTIDPSRCPPHLLERLREETAGLLPRLNLKRDFPYRLKRLFPVSFTLSLALVLFFQMWLQWVRSSLPLGPALAELEVVAQGLSLDPRYEPLAEDLQALVNRIARQGLTPEKHSSIEELRQEIERQMAGRDPGKGSGSDLLGQATDSLRGLEERGQKGQGEGGGLKFDGPGEGGKKESNSAGGGEGKEGLAVLGGDSDDGGKPVRSGGGIGGENTGTLRGAERDEKGRGEGKEAKGRAEGEGLGRSGRGKQERLPKGKVPERFRKGGKAGEKRIKGARFVTVELPEREEPSSTTGEVGGRGVLKPKVPVSNLPLPHPSTPEARRERQLVPLEYRALIP